MCRAPVGEGAKRTRGAVTRLRHDADRRACFHSGRPAPSAVERGVERDCEAIQIFNQSPRMWRPTAYGADGLRRLPRGVRRLAGRGGRDPRGLPDQLRQRGREIQRKSLASLTHALRLGDAIGAGGVVLHAGARKGEPHEASMRRAGKAIARRSPSPSAARCCSRTPPARRARSGRNFDELAELVELGRRRRAARRLPRLLPPVRLRLRDPHAGGARARSSTSSTPRSGSSGCAACTSTTRRCRWAPTATTTPTSARASSGDEGSRRSSPSRASRSCRR